MAEAAYHVDNDAWGVQLSQRLVISDRNSIVKKIEEDVTVEFRVSVNYYSALGP